MEGFFGVWADHPRVVTLLVVFISYLLSLMVHPYVPCRECGGKAIHKAGVWTYAHRKCHRCSGAGRKQRLGARMLGIGDRRVSTPRSHGAGKKVVLLVALAVGLGATATAILPEHHRVETGNHSETKLEN